MWFLIENFILQVDNSKKNSNIDRWQRVLTNFVQKTDLYRLK